MIQMCSRFSLFSKIMWQSETTYVIRKIKRKVVYSICRSSHPEVFCKNGALQNFTKFTGKRLCQSPFFNKVAGLRPATLLKKRLWDRCFPVNFTKFLKTPFFTELLWRLLQHMIWLFLKKLVNIFRHSFPNY